MDVSAIADMSTGMSLAQTQDTASTLILNNAINFEQSSAEQTVQMMNSIPPSDAMLDMKA